MPATAPTFFFIDIQPDQRADFDALVAAIPGVSDMQRVPMLRGRITARQRRARRPGRRSRRRCAGCCDGDRGLTWSATRRRAARSPAASGGRRIIAARPWSRSMPKSPPPSVSSSATPSPSTCSAASFTGSIANFREIDWSTLTINFVMVFSPGVLEGAPQTHIATARIPDDAEIALQNAVPERFPNVSSIRVKEALETVNRSARQRGRRRADLRCRHAARRHPGAGRRRRRRPSPPGLRRRRAEGAGRHAAARFSPPI